MLFFCKEGHPIRIANEMPSYQLVSHTCHTSSFTWRRDISLYNLHFFQPSCFLSVLLALAQSHLSRLVSVKHPISLTLFRCVSQFSTSFFYYYMLIRFMTINRGFIFSFLFFSKSVINVHFLSWILLFPFITNHSIISEFQLLELSFHLISEKPRGR